MKIYMAVTPDRLELPVAVADAALPLAVLFGVTKNYVHSAISKRNPGKKLGVKFVRVDIEEDDIDDG